MIEKYPDLGGLLVVFKIADILEKDQKKGLL